MKPIYIVSALVIVLIAGLAVTHGKGTWPFTQARISTPTPTSTSTASSSVTTTTTAATTSTVVTAVPPKTVPPAPVPKTTSGIRGSVTIGPTCPVQKDPPDPACADKPYQTTLVVSSTIVGRNGGVLVQTDAQGHFTKELIPGTYTIRSTSNGTPPTLAPVTLTVKPGAWTQVNLTFDSGIR